MADNLDPRQATPQAWRLICYSTAEGIVPPDCGREEAFDSVVELLIDQTELAARMKAAAKWAAAEIAAIKAAPDNAYGDDSEAIAGEVIRQIERKQRKGTG